MPLKICKNCFQEFEDEAVATVSSVEVLGEIFIEAVGGDDPGTWDARSLCPACKEKLGIVTFLVSAHSCSRQSSGNIVPESIERG